VGDRQVHLRRIGEPYAATGSRLLSAGWRRLYPYSEAKEKILPPLTAGENLPILSVTLEEKTDPTTGPLTPRAGSFR